jgi:thiol-disulfide isomerase/thioredoxin
VTNTGTGLQENDMRSGGDLLTVPAAAMAAVLAIAPLCGVVRGAEVGTSPPATRPARDAAERSADLRANGIALGEALSDDTLFDPAKRSAAAPTVVPLVRREQELLDEVAAARHAPLAFAAQQQTNESMLYLFGDPATVTGVDAAARSSVVADALRAKGIQLHARWLAAGHDDAAQQVVADDLERLDAAHPEDPGLTRLTFALSQGAAAPPLQLRLLTVAAETMRNPLAMQYEVLLQQAKATAGAEAKQKEMEGKPLAITGTTVDGKPFTTAAYAGKVVLVDFWATWCAPCRAEMPRVREMYAKYHAKGLEVVGVSNDFSIDPLKAFVTQTDMPWVELFDAAAASEHRQNPATESVGIETIPVMFLIDRRGVLRTVDARQKMEQLIPALLAE